MANTVPSKKFGEREFYFGVIPAKKALKLELIAGRLVLPLIAAAQETGSKAGAKSSKQLAQVAAMELGAIKDLCSEVDYDTLLDAMETVFATVSVAGIAGGITDMDAVFTGTPLDKWLVFVEALKISFAPFFDAAGSLFGSTPPQK